MRGITGSSSWLIILAGWVIILLGTARAQVPTATISGTIRDSSGAVVSGATVTATNRDTALSRATQTGTDGHYQLSSLPVGIYNLKTEMTGFQTQIQQNLNLSVGQEAVLNFSLPVGSVQETVSVTAEAPLVDTTSGSLGGLVNEAKVTELPLNGRSFNNLALLQTGVVVHHPVSTTSTTSIGLAFSSNGAPIRSNFVTLDGAAITSSQGITGVSSSGLMLGVDAIREFRIINNNFPAEYGMTMGSQMVIVSKAGGNQIHGAVFDFLRNSAMDSRNFFSQTNPPYHRNNFGGSLGGPLKKDKDFYFVSYEGVRELLGVPLLLNVPNMIARTDGGLGVAISPAVVPYLNLYPLPNGTLPNDPTGKSGVGTYAYSFNQPTNESYGQARWDHNFSDRNQLFARYTIDDTSKTAPSGSNPSAFVEDEDSRGQYLTLAENHTFSPSVLNTVRLSYVRPFQSFLFPNAPGTQGLGFLPGYPFGSIGPGSGITTLGGGNPLSYKEGGFTFSDDVAWVKGKHSMKFGTLMNRYRTYLSTNLNIYGAFTFASLSQFLTNVPLQLSIITPGSITDRTYVWNTFGFYGQDEWRATSRLTLTIGLRYEFNTTVNEVTGTGSSVRSILRDTSATLGGPLFKNPSLANFAPRFGFAWDVTGDGKTAVRGGFGIFYDIAQMVGAADIETTATPPFSSTTTLTNGLCFPACTVVPSINTPSSIPPTLRTVEYDQAQPHMLSYNLTVERQLPGSMVLSLGYAGSRGLNLIQTVEGDPAVPQILANNVEFWPAGAPRENPAWTYCECKTTGGDSWYNSLQVRLQKQLTHNLQFQASYTFSKVLDDTQGQHGGEAGGSIIEGNDPFHLSNDKGPADFNTPDYFTFNTLYGLPSPGVSGVAGALLKGWRMSTIVSVTSGLPFSVYLSSNRSRSGVLSNATDRADVVPGCSPILGSPNEYFNPACFSIQPAGFLGSEGRNTLMGPLHANWDFSLIKDTPLHLLGEGKHLEFRAEFFNILNHPDFNIPTTGRTAYTATATSASVTPLATAGQISNTLEPARQIQLALKIIF